MGPEAGVVDRAAIERRLGLDAPIHVQYGRWVGQLLQGNLGTMLRGEQPVVEQILPRIPVTLELGVFAVVIGLLISMPIGIYSAIRQDSAGDYGGRSLAIIFISVPSFWTATIVMVYPAIWWGWAPPLELITFAEDPLGNLRMFLLPAALLGTALSGTTMRMTRTMALEVLRQDYIRTAWSKGLKEGVVVVRHALKNALIPVVTLVGFSAAHPHRRVGHHRADLCPARHRPSAAERPGRAGVSPGFCHQPDAGHCRDGGQSRHRPHLRLPGSQGAL